MKRRNLFDKLTNPSSSLPLKPFDLSSRRVYSARAGLCIPEISFEVYKGDKFKIDTTVFNRTERLLKPAYFRCKQFHHYFFVPFHTLWHEWDSFYTRSTEKLSSATLGNAYFPNFDVLKFIYDQLGQASGTDMLGFKLWPGIDRMLEMLHYGSMDMMDSQTYDSLDPTPTKFLNLAKILAYNKIWYWYYRDKRHDANYFSDFVKLYNVDDINCSTFANSHVTDQSRLLRMFAPKYRCWDSDVFSNNFADTQFGSVSVLNAESIQITSVLDNNSATGGSTNKMKTYRVGVSTSGTVTSTTQHNTVIGIRDENGELVSGSRDWNIPSLFDILQLRKAEAVQHWRELMLRAGDSSKKRYIAMFGSAPNRSEEAPNLLGGFEVNLNVDDVTSTAYLPESQSNESIGLGDLAGKGFMVKQNGTELEFTAPDAGIFMCISSIMPLAEYDGGCIDKSNMLIEPTDFYVPQFDKLGFEPIILAEQFADGEYMDMWDRVLGYTVRNHHLKTNVDRVYGNFRSGKPEAYWCCPKRQVFSVTWPSGSNYYQNYYISPSVVNGLFDRTILASTTNVEDYYNQDQFKCLSYFHITGLRPMSELGLPNL